MDEHSYTHTLSHQRQEKDAYFARGADSPIPHKERASFKGLNYYPPNLTYRFTVDVTPYDAPEVVILGSTRGDERPQLRYGYVEFTVGETPCRLSVYTNPDGYDGMLFIPFRDATSGGETYGAGRYVELEGEDDGKFVLDFNLAYSPWCAYNELYSCVLPPVENHLAVAIEAGEKTYHP